MLSPLDSIASNEPLFELFSLNDALGDNEETPNQPPEKAL